MIVGSTTNIYRQALQIKANVDFVICFCKPEAFIALMNQTEAIVSEIHEQVDRDLFLAAMSRIANSVTVVTTDGPSGRHGATVSSFCSVSADPPQLLVCLNHSGKTAAAVLENKRFCVNVLPETAQQLAILFAGQTSEKHIDRFSDETWGSANGHLPVLEGATAFECDVIETVKSTSHYVFIGEVTAASEGDKPPLIYLNRRFCKTTQI